MIKIAICDDEISELKRVKGYISEYLENHLSFEVYFECFLVPFELLNHIE
ncbi:MAG: DNA-binding response regulator, partial [Clostridium sp.]|nr:DNA-binding response regulator [Clostridium sp.]